MYIWELLTNGGNAPSREGLLNVIAFIFALLVALILHEVAHGLVAKWNGDNTAQLLGRLSINPVKHVNLLGLLMLLIVGFGWANPVPVNPNNFKNKTTGMITVSLAGVTTNFIIAFFASGAYLALAFFASGLATSNHYLFYFLTRLFILLTTLNVSFGLFNLLPLYPLDGFRLIASFVPHDNAILKFLQKNSFYIILICIVIGNVFPEISPFGFYINTLGNGITSGFISFWRLIFGI